jgi:hypothetical protein
VNVASDPTCLTRIHQVGRNQLTALPCSMQHLTNLVELNVCDNNTQLVSAQLTLMNAVELQHAS